MRSGEGIRFEPEERCPPLVAAVAGLQGMVLILTTSVLYASIIAVGAGQDEAYLAWTAFAALAINGAGTALQAARVGRVGTGHVLTTGTATPFIAISITGAVRGRPGPAGEPGRGFVAASVRPRGMGAAAAPHHNAAGVRGPCSCWCPPRSFRSPCRG